MTTLFISDLHLEDSRPQATAALKAFLRGPAIEAEAVYVLGDLFEFWIGDDAISDTAVEVADAFFELQQKGVTNFFIHGNRDFLIGSKFARKARFNLLPETYVLDLYGTPCLVLHGDTLCTDDEDYQAFRKQVRQADFQKQFLSLPVEQRLEVAQNARDASKRHTGTVTLDIMDVNTQAVVNAFQGNAVNHMIHGHTHRPAFHEHELEDGSTAKRMVLADWYDSGSYLQADEKGFEVKSFDFP